MTEQHPISPSPDLVRQWAATTSIHKSLSISIATRAAQWGWDQREPEIQQAADDELEACCEWLSKQDWTWLSAQLRAARRPKPPSAIEQAESLIERHQDGWVPNPAQWHVIREGLAEGRRTLEALPDD